MLEMDEEEIEPDIREQMFHSTVREYIVSSLFNQQHLALSYVLAY